MDLGFGRAGYRTVGLCEADPWRRRALARHWPGVPCHPDLAEFADWCERDPDGVRDWMGGQPDVLIGGTPCQDLSAAGRRAGLAGERSGLFFCYARVRDALGVEWCVWENVAGALTSNGGLDFMAVVGALVGAECSLPGTGGPGGRPGGRTSAPRAGVAAGPLGGVVWRLLNAQHFGVPQRRRRVFAVGHLGAECPPEVLLERAVGGRDHGARREARPGAPWAAAARAGVSGRSGLARGRGAGGGPGRAGAPAGDGGGAPGAGALRGDGVGGAVDGGHGRGEGLVEGGAGDVAAADDRGAARDPGAGDRLPRERADGLPEGRRQRPGADGVGDACGERGLDAQAADADGVREAPGVAGRLDGRGLAARGLRLSGPGERGDVLSDVDVSDALDALGPRPSPDQGVTIVAEFLTASTAGRTGFDGGDENTLRAAEAGGGRAPGHDPAHGLDPPPDGRRYAACGDGVAAPCAHWIGLRLAAAARGEAPPEFAGP